MESKSAMPARSVTLTDELDRFVLKKVKNGRYEKRQRGCAGGLANA
jgi:hypothetical protein